MTAARNLIVAQSGGPSAVINNSLRGLVETARELPEIGTIYAGWHGIEGVLKEELLNLSEQDPQEIALLRTTPAAGAIGTCRYKIRPDYQEDFQRILDVFRAHQIGYFCYIGGNDSMSTAYQISELAQQAGLNLVSFGIPKTIDNDLGDDSFELIDHTPGYGSTARYWSQLIQLANQENLGSCRSDPVLVLQAMGRRIGFIPAAARLADPERKLPLQIYLAEQSLSLQELCDNVHTQLKQDGRVIVVLSEGLQLADLGNTTDAFGHPQFSASQSTVAQYVINALNHQGLPVKGVARANIPGTDQRHQILSASPIDLQEAYQLGQTAALLAAQENQAFMSTLLRKPPISPDSKSNQSHYQIEYDQVPLNKVAQTERKFPRPWITSEGTDVTDEFVNYAKPLLGDDWVSVPLIDGRIRLACLRPLFADQKLGPYTLQADR